MNEQNLTITIKLNKQPESYNQVYAEVTLSCSVPDETTEVLRNVIAEKIAMVEEQVRGAIDRDFETGHIKPAMYSTEPRGYIVECSDENIAVLVNYGDKLPGKWRNLYKNHEKHRLAYLRNLLLFNYSEYTAIDCTDRDFSKLPPINGFSTSICKDLKMLVLHLSKDDGKLPQQRGLYWSYSGLGCLTCTEPTAIAKAKAQADEKGYIFYDCIDGDFSKLLIPEPKPEPEPEPEIDEDDEDEE